MAEEHVQLRTYAFIDSMQPQFAAFLGSELDGDVPLSGMAELWMELAPGSEVYNLLDSALKTCDASPGFKWWNGNSESSRFILSVWTP